MHYAIRFVNNRRWSLDNDAQLVALAEAEVSFETIARNLGRTPEACRRRVYRLIERAQAED